MRTSLPFALIFSLVLSWSPTNAQDATSEGSHISAPFLRSAQTLDGQPLWTLAPAAHFSAQDAHDGEIRGVVVTDGTGQPLTNQRIELRQPHRSERLVTTTDASGSFVYHGLSPGRYEIELHEEDRAVLTNGPLELFEGNMQIRDVKMVHPASDWSRVVALTPQADVVVAVRGSKPTRGRIVHANQSFVTVNIVKPVVNVVTRTEVIARETSSRSGRSGSLKRGGRSAFLAALAARSPAHWSAPGSARWGPAGKICPASPLGEGPGCLEARFSATARLLESRGISSIARHHDSHSCRSGALGRARGPRQSASRWDGFIDGKGTYERVHPMHALTTRARTPGCQERTGEVVLPRVTCDAD